VETSIFKRRRACRYSYRREDALDIQFPAERVKRFDYEPKKDGLGINRLTGAFFQSPSLSFGSTLDIIRGNSSAEFIQSPESFLILEFDDRRQGGSLLYSDLGMEIKY